MTDNKIIKTLQEMVDYPHYYEEGQELKEVLDLINRQRAEVEKYKTYYETMETELDSFRKDQAEVKFLKNRIRAEAVKEFAERLKKDFYDLEFNADTERKTVRVSELREQMDWVLHTVSIEIINDLAKEMAGDQSRDK